MALKKELRAQWSWDHHQLRDSVTYWDIKSRKVQEGEDYAGFVSCILFYTICFKQYLETGYMLDRKLFWASKTDFVLLLCCPHYV